MTSGPLILTYHRFKGFELNVQVCFNRLSYSNILQNKIFKEHIQAAVEEKWSGEYPLTDELEKSVQEFLKKFYPQEKISNLHRRNIPFTVKLNSDPLSGVYAPRILYLKRLLAKKRRPIPVFLGKSPIFPSHVASGFLRRFWGFFRYGRIVTFGLNWSRNFPGYTRIHKHQNLRYFKSLSAHEFGHLFGLDDAYDAWYRFYYAAPGTENYMMHYNRQVHTEEIAMLIRAYTRNRMQFFPIKFKFKNIRFGFKKEVKVYQKKIKELNERNV